MQIDINKSYKTRDGKRVRILCTDAPLNQDYAGPVLGFIEGGSDVCCWTAYGSWQRSGAHCRDLIECPRETLLTGFVVHIEFGKSSDSHIFVQREGAYAYANAEVRRGHKAFIAPLSVYAQEYKDD